MKNFVTSLRNSHIKGKRRSMRTMQLRGFHEKETAKINNTNKFVILQIKSESLTNINIRFSVLESMFIEEMKEFEKLQLCQEIADDLRF